MKSLATSMEPLNIFNVCIGITPYTFRPRLWCYNCLFLFYQPIIFSYGWIYIIIIMIIVLFFTEAYSFYDYTRLAAMTMHIRYAHLLWNRLRVMGTDDVLLALQSFYVHTHIRPHIFNIEIINHHGYHCVICINILKCVTTKIVG